jgi:hypothetical protein
MPAPRNNKQTLHTTHLPMLEFRLLFGFAQVTVGKNTFNCKDPQLQVEGPKAGSYCEVTFVQSGNIQGLVKGLSWWRHRKTFCF